MHRNAALELVGTSKLPPKISTGLPGGAPDHVSVSGCVRLIALICVSFVHAMGAGIVTAVDGIAPTAAVPLLETVKLPGSRNVLYGRPELGTFDPIDTASEKNGVVGLLPKQEIFEVRA